MPRRFQEEGRDTKLVDLVPRRRNVQEFRERFQATFERKKPRGPPSVISEVEFAEEDVEVSGRLPKRVSLREVTGRLPFCNYLDGTLFRKGARITNKQQMKQLALQYFERRDAMEEELQLADVANVNIRIAILNVVCNGYSDVVFGYKIFQYMIDWYPNCTIHLLTTNLEAYRELGLDQVPSSQSGSSIRQKPRHEIKQLLLKRQFVGEEFMEKNLYSECHFNLSHLQLDTTVPYQLILVAPIVYAGDATIGKVRKLFKYSKLFNTYFISDYNMPRYEKAVTNIDLPTGLGPDNYGLLFTACPDEEQLQKSPELTKLLPIDYGVATLGVDRPEELNCFANFVLQFLNQYPNEEVIDLVIGPDIVRSILRSNTKYGDEYKEYRDVLQLMTRLLTNDTNYSVSISYIEPSEDLKGTRRTTPERYQRYRDKRDEDEFESVAGESVQDVSDAFSVSSDIASRSGIISGYARNPEPPAPRNSAEKLEWIKWWKNEVMFAAKEIENHDDRAPTTSEMIFFNRRAATERKRVQLLRLRGDIFPIPYAEIDSLYYNAKPPVLITSDQTLTDLLGCNLLRESFFYQIRPWKQTFARLLGDELDLGKISEAADVCSDQRGSVTVAAKVPTTKVIERFRRTNDFRTKARKRMDAIVSLIAYNMENPQNAWNVYTDLVDGKYVVKAIKKTLRRICSRS